METYNTNIIAGAPCRSVTMIPITQPLAPGSETATWAQTHELMLERSWVMQFVRACIDQPAYYPPFPPSPHLFTSLQGFLHCFLNGVSTQPKFSTLPSSTSAHSFSLPADCISTQTIHLTQAACFPLSALPLLPGLSSSLPGVVCSLYLTFPLLHRLPSTLQGSDQVLLLLKFPQPP